MKAQFDEGGEGVLLDYNTGVWTVWLQPIESLCVGFWV